MYSFQCGFVHWPDLQFRTMVEAVKTKVPSRPDPLICGWEIHLNTLPRKIIAITLILATSGVLIYHSWWLFLAAWITRAGTPDPAIYERAIRYDPENADYRFVLAQIYNYSTQYQNLERAREEYEAAVRLNPDRSAHWLELSKYYEQQGNAERTRFAMSKALETDPNYAQTHWAAANLLIRFNDLPAADFELRRTADLDVGYLTQILDLVWRFYEDPDRIMTTHVPNTKDANLTALNYFISKKSERGTDLAWTRLKSFETRPQERFGYIEYLVSLGRPHDAWRIFAFPQEDPDLIFNPSFETQPMNAAFDWRINTSDNAEARRDTTVSKEGLASLLVNFNGQENVNYFHVWRWLPAEKGKSYNLRFWMKTEGISTNEGVYVEVDGQTSEKQLGTTYWQEFNIPFVASADLVTTRLRRTPSQKFDNLLKGKVWLDGFAVTEVR